MMIRKSTTDVTIVSDLLVAVIAELVWFVGHRYSYVPRSLRTSSSGSWKSTAKKSSGNRIFPITRRINSRINILAPLLGEFLSDLILF